MGRGTKSCLGCSAVLLLLVCVVCVVASVAAPLVVSVLTASLTANLSGSIDPARARQVGAQIGSYTLPPAHSEQAGVDLWVVKLVVITPNVFNPEVNLGDGYLISLFASPLPVDSASLEKQLLDALLAQTTSRGIHWQQTGVRPLTIRGQPTTLEI